MASSMTSWKTKWDRQQFICPTSIRPGKYKLISEANRSEGSQIAFSPDGRSLLSGSIDTTVRLWDISSGMIIRRFDGHKSGVMSVAFSPDSRYAVSGSQDGTVIVWDFETGDLLRQIKNHEGVVHFVNFVQDRELIRSASEDGKINLWHPLPSLDDLFTWIRNNRFIPALACDQQLQYGLVTICEEQSE